MKLLLTSGGFTNKSIITALRELVQKPLNKLKLAYIPTAATIEAGDKGWLIQDLARCKNEVGFKEIDIVDISAIHKKFWLPRLENADVLLLGGGNTYHLMFWILKSGLIKELPKLLKTRVYVGISAGSMVVSKKILLSTSVKLYGMKFGKIHLEKGLGFVDFHVRPHLQSPDFPAITEAKLRIKAKVIKETIYAIDDQSALQIDEGRLTIISEGNWLKLN